MKMAKKLLAVVLAGVLALSVLTGCGNAASTKTIADAMSDMGKNEGIVYKADPKLNEKARLIAEKLSTYEDEEESLAAMLEEDKEEGSEGNLEEEIPTIVMDLWALIIKTSTFGLLLLLPRAIMLRLRLITSMNRGRWSMRTRTFIRHLRLSVTSALLPSL